MQSQKRQNVCLFPRQHSTSHSTLPFNITVIQVYALTSNAEEAEVEWFYEDLHNPTNLDLELTSRTST